jgi:hypothetical protein
LACTLLPIVQNLSAAVTQVLVFMGVILCCFLSNKRPGATLILGGFLIGILPMLVNGYLVRLTGYGCHP